MRPRRRPWGSCARKRRFESFDQANRRTDEIRAQGGPSMRVYDCSSCGYYHLTKFSELEQLDKGRA